jgi:hypothetical protein
MNRGRSHILITTLLLALMVVPAAVAGGNARAQPQATDQLSPQRVIQGDGQNLRQPAPPATSLSSPAASSETGPAAEATMRATAGKAKSQQPPASSVVLVQTNSSFHWGDAGIGAAAAAGIILVLLGGLITRAPRAQRAATPQLGASEQ